MALAVSRLLQTSGALDEVAAAGRRAQELADRDRELHFHQGAGARRVVVEVRDLKGTVICTIPPSFALDVMAGLADVD